MGLKKKLGIKWIADFRDPWTNIDFYKDLMLTKSADRKHHRLEREVLETADEIITIGKTMAMEFEEIRGRKVQVITNGFDADDFKMQEKGHSDDFVLVHVGSINADRNHTIFWEGLQELCTENPEFAEKLRIRFIGKLDYSVIESVESYGLKDKFEQIEYVPHNQVKDYLFAADLLYLPLNNTPNSKGILSGKFFEYLATAKPILGIGHPKGDAAEIMQETQAGAMIDFTDKEALKQYLIKEFESRNETQEVNIEKRNQYSRRMLTQKLVELF